MWGGMGSIGGIRRRLWVGVVGRRKGRRRRGSGCLDGGRDVGGGVAVGKWSVKILVY